MTLLFSTFVHMQPNSSLLFINNIGRVSGGALYNVPDDSAYGGNYDCFLYFLQGNLDSFGFDSLPSSNVQVEFARNQAPTGSIYHVWLES